MDGFPKGNIEMEDNLKTWFSSFPALMSSQSVQFGTAAEISNPDCLEILVLENTPPTPPTPPSFLQLSHCILENVIDQNQRKFTLAQISTFQPKSVFLLVRKYCSVEIGDYDENGI